MPLQKIMIRYIAIHVIATDKQTKNIIVIIFLQVMCRFGCPEVVITDQGREFVNELSSRLYQMTNTKH